MANIFIFAIHSITYEASPDATTTYVLPNLYFVDVENVTQKVTRLDAPLYVG